MSIDLSKYKGITPGRWWASGLEVGTAPTMIVKIATVSGANIEEANANAILIADIPDILAYAIELEGQLKAVRMLINNQIAELEG